MLIVLMYHRVNDPTTGRYTEQFRKHLNYLASNFRIVARGEQVAATETAVQLTFDDALFDFYHTAWPILKEMKIPSTLAVPVQFIKDESKLRPAIRLASSYPKEFDNQDNDPFCTWQELREMNKSPLLEIASHSYSHADMSDPNCDHRQEIIKSKEILVEKLASAIDSFIYPYGNMNKAVQQLVAQHYKQAYRIGSAINLDSQAPLQYRIDAEHYWLHNKTLPDNWFKFKYKYWLNRLRNK